MNFSKLDEFIKRAGLSKNAQVKQAAQSLEDAMIQDQEAETVAAPGFEMRGDSMGQGGIKKDLVDQMISPVFKDLAEPGLSDSTFGKSASAFTSDVTLGDLPADTLKDITRLVPAAQKKSRVVLYGMVVDELLPKVDPHNFDLAESRVKQDLADKGKKSLGDKFQAKLGTKYVLLLNDKIVDGHHFLALAKCLGISCSLRVLDLTPIRFQMTKTSSLLEQVRRMHDAA